MKTEDADKLHKIGKGAYAAIVEMVAALNCDYERLQELTDERQELEDAHNDADQESENARLEAKLALKAWDEENAEELAELQEEAGECEDADQARERIQEDALSVEVRSGWTSLGDPLEAEEFCILLTTGGPAVRIRGELNEDGEPARAWLEVQDWFLPWTEYVPADGDVLLDYARCFYFGE